MKTTQIQHKKEIAAELSRLLASSYLLFVKTQHFHWNVTGSHFQSLHSMFEMQYNDLFEANDLIAERIRALGELAPGDTVSFAKLSFISESTESPRAEKMVEILLADHQKIIDFLRPLIEKCADAKDEATNNILAPRIEQHEKTAWMLRSFLE